VLYARAEAKSVAPALLAMFITPSVRVTYLLPVTLAATAPISASGPVGCFFGSTTLIGSGGRAGTL